MSIRSLLVGPNAGCIRGRPSLVLTRLGTTSKELEVRSCDGSGPSYREPNATPQSRARLASAED